VCGIIGIINALPSSSEFSNNASYDVYRGLLTLQHRGQDSAGILTYDHTSREFHLEKRKGLVSNVFDKSTLEELKGNLSIGHTRYVTVGSDHKSNIQPMVTGIPFGIGMVHNGNILNFYNIKKILREETGSHLLSNNDVELILNLWCHHMINMSTRGFELDIAVKALREVYQTLIGAYSVVGIVSGMGLFAFRDPHGIRPLVLGKKEVFGEPTSWCFTSETLALNILGYEYEREVKPGEFIFIDNYGNMYNTIIKSEEKNSHCMFEWVYFSGVESELEGMSVYTARLNLGKHLSKKIQHEIDNKIINPDVVVPVPDTSRTAAIAIAETLKLPYREALIKNRYVYRSFILGNQQKREQAVEQKLSPVKSEILGKNILLVDDSIVRGTTSKKIVALLKRYGASSVTLVSTCPPLRYPCFYGVDFPSEEELIASHRTEEEIAQILGVDRVIYLNIADLKLSLQHENLCLACLNNDYPTPITDKNIFQEIRTNELKTQRGYV